MKISSKCIFCKSPVSIGHIFENRVICDKCFNALFDTMIPELKTIDSEIDDILKDQKPVEILIPKRKHLLDNLKTDNKEGKKEELKNQETNEVNTENNDSENKTSEDNGLPKKTADGSFDWIEKIKEWDDNKFQERYIAAVKKNADKPKTQEISRVPRDFKDYLDKYVIGQDEAKRVLSTALYNHLKRIKGTIKTEKSNVLLVGPTGCGKTLLVKTLAKELKLPFIIADATKFSDTGWKGDDVENILARLIEAAGGDIDLAQKGIIFIDEIDKLSKKTSEAWDVVGEKVQQNLLKMMEGCVMQFPYGHSDMKIDTSNILFVCSGAFPGLNEIIEKRKGKRGLGFVTEDITQRSENLINPEDLISYGLIPEFVGRLSIIIPLKGLDITSMRRILTEPEDSVISQFKELCHSEGVEFEVSSDAIEKIAKQAIDEKTGARGLRAIVEKAMRDVLYELPSEKERISKVVLNVSEDKVIATMERKNP